MEYVEDIAAPPFVEFVNVQMEFHPDGPQRPNGPIIFDLNTRDEQGNPRRQDY